MVHKVLAAYPQADLQLIKRTRRTILPPIVHVPDPEACTFHPHI